MDTNQLPQLLRAEQLAGLYGISKSQAYALASSGDLPSVRLGRSIRFPVDALRVWVQRNTTGGAAQ